MCFSFSFINIRKKNPLRNVMSFLFAHAQTQYTYRQRVGRCRMAVDCISFNRDDLLDARGYSALFVGELA